MITWTLNQPWLPRVRQDFGRGIWCIEVVLEGGRLTGRGCFRGRWQSAEALDVDGDGGQDVLEVGLV
ncbi:hypothetical protein, partial [Streptomyces sp. H27-C3]|uniref:hypothetical protein n=1 Tax=Streptomyces sp. H27-C3 TaxID=3046305 RepID=UPI0024BB21C1